MEPFDGDERPRRVEVIFRGRVQGVGFRQATLHVAMSHRVAGYVQNLPDGTVCLVVEGEAAELDQFLAGVERAMAGRISSRDVRWRTATGEFADFDVR